MAHQGVQKFSYTEVQNHPELLANLLHDKTEITLMVRRSEDEIIVYPQRAYHQEVNDILSEAEQVYQEKKAQGYNRQQAIKDFDAAQQEISKHCSK